MKLVGLTGGIATGKSEVTKILREQGISVFDADHEVHELYKNGQAAEALKLLCPTVIVGMSVDRQKLSKLISETPSLLKGIESIIHPLVNQREKHFIDEARGLGKQFVVIDSPLLIEMGRHQNMDCIVLVATTLELQKQRAMARPGMTKEKLDLILSKQMTTDEKRKYSNYVIENNAGREELRSHTIAAFNKLMGE